jgi:predicted Fe-Mo cluster-binding NifX family protein
VALSSHAIEKGDKKMRIAIPLAQGKLSQHFGHCEEFALIDVDTESNTIGNKELIPAPDHQPGLLPRWLKDRGVSVVISGGMGRRALTLFEQEGIKVHIGAPSESPNRLVQLYLEGNLPVGVNMCDH